MSFLRILAIGVVFLTACIGWMILGGVTVSRTSDVSTTLDDQVGDLWGTQQTQMPPELTFRHATTRWELRSQEVNGKVTQERVPVVDWHHESKSLESTDIDVHLGSDLRRKGLLWYSLYAVQLTSAYSYIHNGVAGTLDVVFRFPNQAADYDAFTFKVNGTEYAGTVVPTDGAMTVSIPVKPEEHVEIAIAYKSRGRDQWTYAPANGVGVLKNFHLVMTTDFQDIDYPASGMSPSTREVKGKGQMLRWDFSHLVTAKQIGLVTPQRLQPGELASSLAFSAPVSLLFFFVVMFMLATLRGIDIHPLNYLMIAGAFFAFHLLFAYTADRLPVEWAFIVASLVSVFLVVSYLRLVVSSSFAYREAAVAQLIYLVGFSLAHFWDGFTGLTVTLLAIFTLFVVMQLTGRIKWSEVLQSTPAQPLPQPQQ